MPLVRVLFFAQLQEHLGQPDGAYPLPAETTVAAVLSHLACVHPVLAGLLPHCRLALDQVFVSGALLLTEKSELAVIPPVSGG